MKSPSSAIQSLPVLIPMEKRNLRGDLVLPDRVEGLVVFVRVDGKYNDYPYDRKTASVFAKYRLATLLVDLPMSEDEPDISAPVAMLHQIINWVRQNSKISHLPLGCFSADLGARVALDLASHPDKPVQAVVCCDGDIDPAMENLSMLDIPVLLIIGMDPDMKRRNEAALEKVKGASSLNVIPHASHTFENVRILEEAAQLAALWFSEHLIKIPAA